MIHLLRGQNSARFDSSTAHSSTPMRHPSVGCHTSQIHSWSPGHHVLPTFATAPGSRCKRRKSSSGSSVIRQRGAAESSEDPLWGKRRCPKGSSGKTKKGILFRGLVDRSSVQTPSGLNILGVLQTHLTGCRLIIYTCQESQRGAELGGSPGACHIHSLDVTTVKFE